MCGQNLEIILLNNASFTSYFKEANQLNFNGSFSVYESLVTNAFWNNLFEFGVADCRFLI